MHLLWLQGSDIETLGSEATVEYGTELLERPPLEKAELQDTQASASGGPDFYIIFHNNRFSCTGVLFVLMHFV